MLKTARTIAPWLLLALCLALWAATFSRTDSRADEPTVPGPLLCEVSDTDPPVVVCP